MPIWKVKDCGHATEVRVADLIQEMVIDFKNTAEDVAISRHELGDGDLRFKK